MSSPSIRSIDCTFHRSLGQARLLHTIVRMSVSCQRCSLLSATVNLKNGGCGRQFERLHDTHRLECIGGVVAP